MTSTETIITIRCRDAKHAREVELSLMAADMLRRIDRDLAGFCETDNPALDPATFRRGLHEVVSIYADPGEFGLKPITTTDK